MLYNVLKDFAADSGLHPVDKRVSLVRILNKAAKEMYNQLECNKIYKEVTVVVPINKVVSLPSFVGELRGMRTHSNEMPFNLESIGQPRYISNTFDYRMKNWRDKGESAVHTLPEDYGPLTIEVTAVEDDPVNIIINGQTNNAARIEETITLDAVSVNTVSLFGGDIFSIACLSDDRTYDITIKDSAGNEIAILYNTEKKTRYRIVDVAEFYWPIDTASNESLIDIAYKIRCTTLFKDTDSFYAGDDFDEAWYNMAMYKFLDPIANRQQEALKYRAAALDFLRSAKEEGDQQIVKKLSFGRNKYYNLIRGIRVILPGSVTNVDNNR